MSSELGNILYKEVYFENNDKLFVITSSVVFFRFLFSVTLEIDR